MTRSPDNSEDPIRQKSVELLWKSLNSFDASIHSPSTLNQLARRIEELVFSRFPDSDSIEYKEKIRVLFSNLRRNQNLHGAVVCESVSPELLASMSGKEMATPELQKEIENIQRESIHNRIKIGQVSE